MKKMICIFILILTAAFATACVLDGNGQSEHASSPDLQESEASYTSERSQSESRPTDSSIPSPEEIYEFLLSPYTVSSVRDAFGTVYECEYYLVDGVVAGVKHITTLPDEESAIDYFELLNGKYPLVSIDGLTVTHYMQADEYYFGYTLEKLKFTLEKTGYEYTVNFDEDIYNEENTSEVSR